MVSLKYSGKKNKQDIENCIFKIKQTKPKIYSKNNSGFFVSGDNFEAMSRLLEEYEGKIDLVYIDIPYNTSSQFFIGDSRTATISSSKSDQLAYDDNMPIEEYLEFIRERLFLVHRLLSDKGSLYLHIDTKLGHYLKIIIDEIFGATNFLNDITRIKSNPKNFSRRAFGNEKDLVLVYARNAKKNIFNNVKMLLDSSSIEKQFKKIDEKGRRYTTVPCHAPGETKNGATGQEWRGKKPPKGRHWRVAPWELEKLNEADLIEWSASGNPRIKKYADEHEGKKMQDIWYGYKDPQYPVYPTEKNLEMLDMIVKQSSNEKSIIMDCFAGSSSFLKAGLRNGRYVIGIDKSPASLQIFKSSDNLKDLELINL